MNIKTFKVYECEHHGDEDSAVSDLRAAGCTNVTVLGRDFEGEESITVRAELPAGMTLRELETKAEVCL